MVVFSFISLGFLIFGFLIFLFFKSEREKFIVKNFSDYYAILSYYMDQAYSFIYKDRIIVYSLEANRMNDDELQQAFKDFVIYLEKLMGEDIKNIFIKFFKSEEVFYNNLYHYFVEKIESDEIRKTAQEELMSQEIE